MYKRLFFVLLIAFITCSAADNEAAPRFNAKTTSGEKFSNASVKGKVVLLQFWTTWCPYCRNEQKIVDQLQQEFADRGLIVLAVDVGEGKKKVQKYLEENPRLCRMFSLKIRTSLLCMRPTTIPSTSSSIAMETSPQSKKEQAEKDRCARCYAVPDWRMPRKSDGSHRKGDSTTGLTPWTKKPEQ